MDETFFYFFGSPEISEVAPDVSAGSSRDVELGVISAAAVRAVPFHVLVQLHLAVVAAVLAVVGFRVELRVHDVIVDELDDFHHGFHVAGEARGLHVADRASRRQSLEFRFLGDLVERGDLLEHRHVVGIGDVIAILAVQFDEDIVAESLLEALRELVRGRFHRRAVQAVIDVFLGFPFAALVVHLLHYLQSELLAFRIRVRLARHVLDALVQAAVSEGQGGIPVQ